MDPYATHIPALSTTIAGMGHSRLRSGCVVELGCGNYSTPWLAAVCSAIGSLFRCYYTNQEWADHMYTRVPSHVQWDHLPSWDTIDRHAPDLISLCFVDQEQRATHRLRSVRALRDRTQVFVIHDYNRCHKQIAKMEFKYQLAFQDDNPQTVIVSDYIDVSRWGQGRD